MNFAHQSYIFENVFSLEEINLLRQDQHTRPNSQSGDSNLVKNIDYHKPYSRAYKIIKPKLDKIIGPDHQFTNGCYREATKPYATHIDNYAFHAPFYSFEGAKKYSCAVLIPLLEDPEFRTIVFDVHSHEDLGMGQPLPEKFLTGHNDLDPAWFSHIEEPARSQISKFTVDKVFNWKLGNMITWSRTQLHASTDFSKFGLCKKFVILWID